MATKEDNDDGDHKSSGSNTPVPTAATAADNTNSTASTTTMMESLLQAEKNGTTTISKAHSSDDEDHDGELADDEGRESDDDDGDDDYESITEVDLQGSASFSNSNNDSNNDVVTPLLGRRPSNNNRSATTATNNNKTTKLGPPHRTTSEIRRSFVFDEAMKQQHQQMTDTFQLYDDSNHEKDNPSNNNYNKNDFGGSSSYDKFHLSFTSDDPLIGGPSPSSLQQQHRPGRRTSFQLNGSNNNNNTTNHRRPVLARNHSEENLLKSKISRVERSWFIISESGRIGHVGEVFFMSMFDEYPELVELFPFGDDAFDQYGRLNKLNKTVRIHIRAHASAVMRVVGTSVAGLTSIEDLVPRLRAVGTTHKAVGVQAFHYDILFRHLVAAIKEEVSQTDPHGWDRDTEEAWYQAFQSIVDLIKRPSKRLETEPLQGWGTIMLIACTYFTLITPVRFGGFFIGFPTFIRILDLLDFIGAMIMVVDLAMDFIQNRFRISRHHFINDTRGSDSETAGVSDGNVSTDASDADADADDKAHHDDSTSKSKLLPPSSSSSLVKNQQPSNSILKKSQSRRRLQQRRRRSSNQNMVGRVARQRRRMLKSLNQWKMDRWVPWPSLDVRVILSFVLQGVVVHASLCTHIGLHWTQLFGLLRVSCGARVLHFLQCAENAYLLNQKLDAQNALQWRIVKLLIRLAFITHVGACLYCACARFELGYGATDFPPTSFFPDPDVLYGPNRNVLQSYSRALHWSFVSLSGIGNTDSVPQSTLECWFTMTIHMIGAIFYAIVTGTVINILEEAAQEENKMGEDMVKLNKFLTTARMSSKSKERIMKGFVLRNVLTEGGGESTQTGIEGLLEGNDQILSTLPHYLRAEVGIYARAELVHRREPLFLHCSNSFLVALSSNLTRTRTLLSGDYLMKKGEPSMGEFAVVEQGSLQVRRDGHTIKTLVRGNCIGKSWLLQLGGGVSSSTTTSNGSKKKIVGAKEPAVSENTDWLRPDGTSGVSIRALGPCVLITGLQTLEEVKQLEDGYQVDFQLLRAEVRGADKLDDSERKAKAMRGIAKAVRRFKERKRLQSKPWKVTASRGRDVL